MLASPGAPPPLGCMEGLKGWGGVRGGCMMRGSAAAGRASTVRQDHVRDLCAGDEGGAHGTVSSPCLQPTKHNLKVWGKTVGYDNEAR